ncbi:MAG: hypothetical protein OEW83_06790 [Acidimicrobiia bacterium]|nr:hypothetical protein [Acidimicrobiia bacterium]
MQLHELLRSCFANPDELRIFLSEEFGQTGRDVWDLTDGAWLTRAFDIATALEGKGVIDRQFFERLVVELPKRADDISACCWTTTGQPLTYVAGDAPPAETFPWSAYEKGMAPSLLRFLRHAAYDARSRGYATISTSEIVRVYLAEQPWVRATLGADDEDLSELDGEADPFDDKLGASFCVSKTVHGLAENCVLPRRFDEHDVFLDLMRFGNGNSVRRLASSGVGRDQLNQLSRQLGIGRVTRHAVLD